MTIKGLYHCSFDSLVKIDELIVNPQNPNRHSEAQIDRLAKIIDRVGQRSPIIVDKHTQIIVAGHGRLAAMRKLGWERVAVDYQCYIDDRERYEHMTADNAISKWSHLDLGEINRTIEQFGPELDIDALGIKDFTLEPMDKFDPSDEWEGMPEFENSANDIEKAYCRLNISFESEIYLQDFARLIGQNLTNKTKAIWHPKKVRGEGIEGYRYDDA